MALGSLDSALSGLRMAQQSINVISTNVSNVNTPGYSRKILPQSSQAINGVTVGVLSETIIRNVDLKLERDLWTQVSATSFYNVQETYLNRVQQFHGDPAKGLSISSDLSGLFDEFAALSDSPEDAYLQARTVDQAVDVANKINDFSKLILTLRNDVQDEMRDTVNAINGYLDQLVNFNNQIKSNLNIGRSTAQLEDERDKVVQNLSQMMGISFFQRGDGVMVVQTKEGVELAAENATHLSFRPKPLGAQSYYGEPGTVAAIYVGDPEVNRNLAVDITADNLGGKLGGLIEMRDVTFPKQMAQLDELAYRTAQRFAAQGLMLFTDKAGTIPQDTPPDPTYDPDALPTPILPTSVSYVGFAGVMRVNQNVMNDNTLLQTGTYGANLKAGSNEVITRVIEHAFGTIDYQQAEGVTDLRQVSGTGSTLQEYLGLYSENEVLGGRDLRGYASVADMVAASNGVLDPGGDSFDIIIQESRAVPPLGPYTMTISLTNADAQPGANAAEQIMAEINAQMTAAGIPASLATSAVIGPSGQIQILSRGSIEIDAQNGVGAMKQVGLDYLGLADMGGIAQAPNDPYFDIAVGNNDLTRIYIEPGDTEDELYTKLSAIEGLAVYDFRASNLDPLNDGTLRLRPGNDYDYPDFGGSIRFVAGTIKHDAAGAVEAGLAAASGSVNVFSALFGTYSDNGTTVLDEDPIIDYGYETEIDGSSATPSYLPFREALLGPGAKINTYINGATSLLDYAQKMINEQSQQLNVISARREDEESLQKALQQQFMDQSGVNLDEELGHLITVQTAYSASARVLTAVDELFQELLNAVR